VSVTNITGKQFVIPDSSRHYLDALEDDEFHGVMDALKTELEDEPSDRTAVVRTEGGEEALLTRLSTGHLVAYRALTKEEAKKHTSGQTPAFLFFGFADGDEPEIKAALESLAS
jgi:hypothetical protein